jgi:large subunit ribosomal protein L24
MHVKKNDNVIIIAGKDKGKSGTISRAIPGKNMVVVEGINLRKRHVSAKKSGKKGEVIEIAVPIHASNVALKDSKKKEKKSK